MYKFGQIEILSKEFNSEYKVTENVDLEKIRLSEHYKIHFLIGSHLNKSSLTSSKLP